MPLGAEGATPGKQLGKGKRRGKTSRGFLEAVATCPAQAIIGRQEHGGNVETNDGKEGLWQLVRSEEALCDALQDVAACMGSNFFTKDVVTKYLSAVISSGSEDLNHQYHIARVLLGAAGFGCIPRLLDPLVFISQTLGRQLHRERRELGSRARTQTS